MSNKVLSISIKRTNYLNTVAVIVIFFSKSTQEILRLVEDILEEACHSSDQYVLRLFYTSRNVMEMYAALIPEIHRSFLETIPQQVGKFYSSLKITEGFYFEFL